MKPLRGAADLLAARAQREGWPVTVTFQVTDRCNYECVHCYQEHDAHDDELSFAEIERILDEIAAMGVLFLTFMGGEFFMRRDADQILAAAHAKGFALKVLTTGHHITDKRADFLATLRPIQFDLSLYAGHKGKHEEITRMPGSWERTVAAARRLLARKMAVLLKAPVMETNVDDVAGMAELATEMGAEFTFDPKITAIETGDQAPLELRMKAETLARFYRTTMAGHLERTFIGPESMKAKGEELRPLHHAPCRAGQQSVSISPNGDVWPCNALPMPCGNLRQQSFAAIWSGSPELASVRGLTWASLAECNRCSLRPYCQRCHGMALVEHGQVAGPSLEACRHAVEIRDSLRERGLIPATETALPPTWDRVDADGQHRAKAAGGDGKRRPAALRVIS
jgi:radical SAM protein with 4Fe4S-binding SPASM domain